MATISNRRLMKDICRLCLKQGNAMPSIFQQLNEDTQTSMLSEKITSMAHVDISPEDGLPMSICHTCRWQIDQCHEFRLLIEMSDKALRSCLKKPPPLQDNHVVMAETDLFKDSSRDHDDEFDIKGMMNYALLVPTTEGLQVWKIDDLGEQDHLDSLDRLDNFNKLEAQRDTRESPRKKMINIQDCQTIKQDNYKDATLLQEKFIEHPADLLKHIYMDDEIDDADKSMLQDLNSMTSCQLCFSEFDSLEELKNHITEHCIVSSENENCLSPPVAIQEENGIINDDPQMVIPSMVTILETNNIGTEPLNLVKPPKLYKKLPNAKLLVCRYCHKSFNKKTLKKHYEEKCKMKDELRLICNECGLKFKKTCELRYHIKGSHHHQISPPMMCSICNKYFRTIQSFKMHMKRHTLGSRYNCDICNQSYYTNSELARHVQIHQEKRKFPCHLCETSFLSKPELNRHMKYHNGVKKFQCNICRKCYYESGHLKIHQKVHTGEKPFVCGLCQKAFVTRSKLARHSKIHVKEQSTFFTDENLHSF